MASFADAFSAVFMYLLNMRPLWKIWNIPILNKSPAMFDNIESFSDRLQRLFIEEAFPHQELWKATINFENREHTTSWISKKTSKIVSRQPKHSWFLSPEEQREPEGLLVITLGFTEQQGISPSFMFNRKTFCSLEISCLIGANFSMSKWL